MIIKFLLQTISPFKHPTDLEIEIPFLKSAIAISVFPSLAASIALSIKESISGFSGHKMVWEKVGLQNNKRAKKGKITFKKKIFVMFLFFINFDMIAFTRCRNYLSDFKRNKKEKFRFLYRRPLQ